jgi:hypothetical protein
MSNIVAENLVTVVMPSTDRFVVDHHNGARAAIDGMPAWRQFGAETNLRSWRRWLKSIDPARDNGWGFSGPELQPGADASLPIGAIVVACDLSWAKAKWHAGDYIRPMEIEAALYEVTSDGLIQLTRSMRRAWARDLLGWLVTNRPEIPMMMRAATAQGTAR